MNGNGNSAKSAEFETLRTPELTLVLMFMQSNNVDLYINGHDHCLEHIKREDRYHTSVQIHVFLRNIVKIMQLLVVRKWLKFLGQFSFNIDVQSPTCLLLLF